MATPTDVDTTIALSDISCRILVVSSSIDQAISFIHRIREYRRPSDGAAAQSTAIAGPVDRDEGDEGDGDGIIIVREATTLSEMVKIPWTIRNRYYSARVHFAAHTVHGLSPHQVRNVPAMIVVWSNGEEYKEHVERLAQDLDGYEPEVSLAVRVRANPQVNNDDVGQGGEEEGEIDEFLSSHGFEYIDATEELPVMQDNNEEGRQYSDGIPNFPRVLDALSTIMWPSMESKSIKANKYEARSQNERAFLNWAQDSGDGSLIGLDGEVVDVSASAKDITRAKRLEAEFTEIARWLEEEADGEGEDTGRDPWKNVGPATAAEVCMSPTSFGEEMEGAKSGMEEKRRFGFDDDFTVFVSAPVPGDEQGWLTHENFSSDDVNKLGPSGGPRSYRSLGSNSDFGDNEEEEGKERNKEKGNDDDDDDDDEEESGLPTREEIKEAAARIFGRSRGTGSVEMEEEETSGYETREFDVGQVFYRLQEMKAEIGRIRDEKERRSAAAKVALGLVYGLEGS